jgi:hypothetical protein
MRTRKRFTKNLKDNWKIWLITLIMALTLMARGLASVSKLSKHQPAASAQPVATTPAN